MAGLFDFMSGSAGDDGGGKWGALGAGLLGMSQGFANAAMPSRMPVPFGAAFGQAVGGLQSAMMQAQKLRHMGQQDKRLEQQIDIARQEFGLKQQESGWRRERATAGDTDAASFMRRHSSGESPAPADGGVPGPAGGNGAPAAGAHAGPAPANAQEFVRMYAQHAQDVAQKTGIDPRLVLAQAGLESGWGSRAPGNNLFGIKGPGQRLATQEFVDGQMTPQQASFRTYGSPQESFQDYAAFIQNNPRYAPVMGAQGLDAQIDAMGKSGYATDPNYAGKLRMLARGMQLPEGAASPPPPQGGQAAPTQSAVSPSAAPQSAEAGARAALAQSTELRIQAYHLSRRADVSPDAKAAAAFAIARAENIEKRVFNSTGVSGVPTQLDVNGRETARPTARMDTVQGPGPVGNPIRMPDYLTAGMTPASALSPGRMATTTGQSIIPGSDADRFIPITTPGPDGSKITESVPESILRGQMGPAAPGAVPPTTAPPQGTAGHPSERAGPAPTRGGVITGVEQAPQVTTSTRTEIEGSTKAIGNALGRLAEVRKNFDPSYLTYLGQGMNAARSAIERSELDSMLPVNTDKLKKYTEFQTITLANLNQSIKDITGAAMSVSEAERITKAMPSMGDSPTTFMGKLDAVERDLHAVSKRNHDMLQGGVRALSQQPAQPGRDAAPARQSMPAIGAAVGAFRFKGGDPNKRENWEAIQ